MLCPKCGLKMKTHQTKNGSLLVYCQNSRECGMVATPQVFGMVDHYEAEATRLETAMRERKPAMAVSLRRTIDGTGRAAVLRHKNRSNNDVDRTDYRTTREIP